MSDVTYVVLVMVTGAVLLAVGFAGGLGVARLLLAIQDQPAVCSCEHPPQNDDRDIPEPGVRSETTEMIASRDEEGSGLSEAELWGPPRIENRTD